MLHIHTKKISIKYWEVDFYFVSGYLFGYLIRNNQLNEKNLLFDNQSNL